MFIHHKMHIYQNQNCLQERDGFDESLVKKRKEKKKRRKKTRKEEKDEEEKETHNFKIILLKMKKRFQFSFRNDFLFGTKKIKWKRSI